MRTVPAHGDSAKQFQQDRMGLCRDLGSSALMTDQVDPVSAAFLPARLVETLCFLASEAGVQREQLSDRSVFSLTDAVEDFDLWAHALWMSVSTGLIDD